MFNGLARIALVASCVAAAATSLAASPSDASGQAPCDVAPADGGELVVWHTLGFAPEALLNELSDEFAERTGTTVRLVEVTGDGGVLRALRSSNTWPDIVLVNQEANVNLSDSGLAVPMQACIDAAGFDQPDLLPLAVAANSIDDTQWSMPIMTSTPVVYFDRTKVGDLANGLGATPRFEDFVALSTQLVADGVVARGFVTASPEWFVSVWAADLGIEFAPSSGRTALGPESFDMVRPALVDRLERVRTGALDGVVEYVTSENFQDLLLLTDPTAPAAFVAHTSGSMKTVYDTLDEAFPAAELGVVPFPDTSHGTVLGGPNAWMLSDVPGQQRRAWAFIDFLASTETQAQIGQLGYTPVRRSSLSDPTLAAAWADRPGLRVASDLLWSLDATPGAFGWNAGPEGAITWRLAWTGRDLVDGRPASDALRDAQTDIDSILAGYREVRAQAAP